MSDNKENFETIKTHILSLSVNNSAGVLSHVAGLFSRRGYNIDSLSVGPTQDKTKSSITLVVSEKDNKIDHIKKQLYKLIDVIEIHDLNAENSIRRELILLTVKAERANKNSIISLANAFKSSIIDINKNAITMELSSTPRMVEAFIHVFSEYNIISISRSGVIALPYYNASSNNK